MAPELRYLCAFVLLAIGSALDSSAAVVFAGDPEKTASPEKTAPKPADSVDAQFRAVLPDGAVIELVGLCEHPTAGREWWRPDGSPLAKVPAGEAPRELTRHPFNVRLGNPNALDRDIAIDAWLPEGAEVVFTGLNVRGEGSASTFKKSDEKKVLQSLRAVAQFVPNSHATLLVHYAPEPWQTYCEFQNWMTRRGKRIRTIGTGAVSRSTEGAGVVMARPSEEQGSTTIIAAFELDDAEHRDFRILAVDTAGKKLEGKPLGPMNANKVQMLIVQFENTPFEKVEAFLFQSRKFQNVGFQNVSLHRGQKTKVAVHIGDEALQGVYLSRRRSRSPAPKEKKSGQ